VPRSINACLRLLCACDGLAITTTEGLGSQAEGFAAVQQAIIKLGGSQCGFCTPGWVSAMAALLARKAASGKTLSKAEIESSFDGNLCRCTGYRPILQAFKAAFADDSTEEERQRAGVADLEELGTTPCHDVRTGEACGRECDQACPPERSSRRLAQDGAPETTRRSSRRLALDDARDATLNAACAAPAGVLRARRRERTLSFEDSATGMRYLRPTTLPALQQALLDTPDALLVCANTGMGVAKYYSPQGPTGPAAQPPQRDATLIDVSQVDVLKTAPAVSTVTPLGPTLTCGAAVTLETLLGAMENAAGGGSATAAGIARQLKRIATTQVRGIGSWAGNLALMTSDCI
jgi:xanthine dehydrogenase/oxidase